MWSRRGFLKSLAVAVGALGASAALAGCGFRPLYGRANTNADGISVDHQMAGIRIAPISNREGQELHNALRDRFNPLGQPSMSDYELDVDLSIRSYGALSKQDLSASRRNVELNAYYTLRDGSGTTVMTDRSMITTGYDEFDDPLNDISAYDDSVRRGTLQLAEQIRTRIAVFLTADTPAPVIPGPPGEPPPGAWAAQ